MLKEQKLYLALILTGWSVMNGCGSETADNTSEVKSICGTTRDFVQINAYTGSSSFVHSREEAVGRLNKNCSGTYIGAYGSHKHLFLTAGHCGSSGAASVEFNYENNADGPVKPSAALGSNRKSSPDYALIALNADPGVAPTPLGTSASSDLTIIQHPEAARKVVAFGKLSGSSSGTRIYYSALDTLGGSSGSGVLNSSGQLVGVHTLGGCSSSGGTNSGWTIQGIRNASAVL